MQKKRLLIINRRQFGHHEPVHSYCRHAANRFDITYMGFDVGKPKQRLDRVTARYVPRRGCKPLRMLRFLWSCSRELARGYDVVFLVYFPGCSILKVRHPLTPFVLDIRTGSISPRRVRRWGSDVLLRVESALFVHATVISESLAEKLRIPRRKRHILPLGADPIDGPAKSFDAFNLLYVGTLNGRRIKDTLLGFERFYREFGQSVQMSYTIVGEGPGGELEELREIVRERSLSDVVETPGYIARMDLDGAYERCNIGVSYVPKTAFYDVQPVTKTFEYMMAGMPVLATATYEHTLVVNDTNGILLEDNAQAFYEALRGLYERREAFDSEVIRRSCERYSWERIVTQNLAPYLDGICTGRPRSVKRQREERSACIGEEYVEIGEQR